MLEFVTISIQNDSTPSDSGARQHFLSTVMRLYTRDARSAAAALAVMEVC